LPFQPPLILKYGDVYFILLYTPGLQTIEVLKFLLNYWEFRVWEKGDRLLFLWHCPKVTGFHVFARSEIDSFACHCEPRRGEAIPFWMVEIAALRSQWHFCLQYHYQKCYL